MHCGSSGTPCRPSASSLPPLVYDALAKAKLPAPIISTSPWSIDENHRLDDRELPHVVVDNARHGGLSLRPPPRRARRNCLGDAHERDWRSDWTFPIRGTIRRVGSRSRPRA